MDLFQVSFHKDSSKIRNGILSNIDRGINEKLPYLTPWELVDNVEMTIIEDTEYLLKKGKINVLETDAVVIGDKKRLYSFSNDVKIWPGVIFDTTNGPIVINKQAEIYPFSTIGGSTYIGKNTLVRNANILGGVSIGDYCKIGGEVENSIIGNFSNKVHNSILAYSYVGDWVNIGGNTSTPPMNLDYKFVKVQYKNTIFKTNMKKFGSVFCDYVRVSSGFFLNPGTYLDYGTMLSDYSKKYGYYPPFTKNKMNQLYSIDEFKNEIEQFKCRRAKTITKDLELKWGKIHMENYG